MWDIMLSHAIIAWMGNRSKQGQVMQMHRSRSYVSLKSKNPACTKTVLLQMACKEVNNLVTGKIRFFSVLKFSACVTVIFLMNDVVRETTFKQNVWRMRNINKKGKDLSTKEDELIESTLFLSQDNKNELNLINKLKVVSDLIEGLGFDCNQKLDVMQSIN